ncbi:MAG: hemolysin family protein [Gemmataceae bacterium]
MRGVELAVMGAMVAVNSVFAAYEIALASVSLSRLKQLAGERSAGADDAAYMKDNMEGSLAGVQLGITLVGAIAAATGGAGAEEQLTPTFERWLGVSSGFAELLAIASVVAPLTAVTIVFGELIPKVFALRNKEWVCLRLSPPMRWFVTAVWPVVWLLETAVTGLMSWGERQMGRPAGGPERTEASELQELRASAAVARMSRLIGPQEERIILQAAGLTGRPVREAMLPADAIRTLDADGSVADALVVAHRDLHTRFPLAERPGDPQSIVGYVNFKDIVAHMRLAPGGRSLREIARALVSFPDDAPASQCMERLIRDHVHIALIRDPAGRVVGMVTLEDLLEELVGDIQDEFDSLPTHVAASGRGWVVGGGVSATKLFEATGLTLPAGAEPAPTVSAWVASRLHPEPVRGGEVVKAAGVRVVVRKVRRQKVQEAQVEADDGREVSRSPA